MKGNEMLDAIESIEILSEPSESGRYEEIAYSDSNDLLWMKFTHESGESWIGKFYYDTHYDILYTAAIRSRNAAMVFSSGTIILVDCFTKQIIAKKGNFINALWLEDLDVIIATDGTSISLVEFEQLNEIWNSRKISFPNIVFDTNSNGNIAGQLRNYFDDEIRFEFNVQDRTIFSGGNEVIPFDDLDAEMCNKKNRKFRDVGICVAIIIIVRIVWDLINQ